MVVVFYGMMMIGYGSGVLWSDYCGGDGGRV